MTPKKTSAKKQVEIVLPTKGGKFDIYKQMRGAMNRLQKEFAEYDITYAVEVSVTASLPPSFTGTVSATLTPKKA